MSILKTNEIQPNTAGSLTITGNATTTGNLDVAGTLSGSVVSGTFHGDGSNLSGTGVSIQEQDGSPVIANATTLKFSNSSVTDEGGGVVSVAITTSGSWFRPASTSVDTGQADITEMDTDTQLTASVTGSLYTPSTTFSSSNPAVISVISQTYVANNRMTVVLSSSAVTGSSITLYAYNGLQQDDTPTTVSTIAPAVPVNPPLLYFDFEEGAGVTLGNKSNTTYVSGAFSASAITGTMGGLFDTTAVRGTYSGFFDGAGGRIVLPSWPNYNMLDMMDTDVSGAFTFSCWVRSNGTGGSPANDYDYPVGAILDIRGSRYMTGYGVYFTEDYRKQMGATKKSNDSQGYLASLRFSEPIYVDDGSNMVADTWYHIVFTCDKGTNQFLYANGQVIANISIGTAGLIKYDDIIDNSYRYEWRTIAGANHYGANGSGYNYMDAGYNGGYRFYNGLIDEVALFDYFMTPEQVAWIYNSGSTPPSLADGVPVLP